MNGLDFQPFHASPREFERNNQHRDGNERRDAESQLIGDEQTPPADTTHTGNRGEREEENEVDEGDHQAERAAETGDDLRGILLFEIWKKRAEPHGETTQG